MPLREEFAATGQWLFRWRSYLPVVLFVPVVAVTWARARAGLLPIPDRGWDLLCLVVSMLGIVVRAVAIGSAPAGTSGRNTAEGQVASTVNTSGMYSVVRHPLYAWSLFLFVGFPLALGSYAALAPGGVAAVILVVRTAVEDRTLRAELEGYEEYARRVRYRLVPGVW